MNIDTDAIPHTFDEGATMLLSTTIGIASGKSHGEIATLLYVCFNNEAEMMKWWTRMMATFHASTYRVSAKPQH